MRHPVEDMRAHNRALLPANELVGVGIGNAWVGHGGERGSRGGATGGLLWGPLAANSNR